MDDDIEWKLFAKDKVGCGWDENSLPGHTRVREEYTCNFSAINNVVYEQI